MYTLTIISAVIGFLIIMCLVILDIRQTYLFRDYKNEIQKYIESIRHLPLEERRKKLKELRELINKR